MRTFLRAIRLSALLISWVGAFGQESSLQKFFEQVREQPVKSNAEVERFLALGDTLTEAPPRTVGRELPLLLEYLRTPDSRVRQYAAGLILAVSIRPDGSQLLVPATDDILNLLADQNPEMQEEAVVVADVVILRAGTDNRRYAAALNRALLKSDGPQGIQCQMLAPLLSLQSHGMVDDSATRSVMTFLRRDDLTDDTRISVLHSMAALGDIPDEVGKELATYGDNTNFRVRVAVIMAFHYAKNDSVVKRALRGRIEKTANDAREEPPMRDLASQALEGKPDLNPNIHPPSDKGNER